ncbi:flavin reductase family protein [Bradyrhizobium sp. BR 1433]|uniref:flavin reductase family protein n=1 Tax=Bradyrhizobium sp. BR 1433 TaxID=3447967 RepID=UPI003EE5BAC2
MAAATDVSQTWTEPNAGDAQALRRAFGSFATGVTVVAAWASSGESRAFTANSFSSVSLDPPLVLVCLGKFSASLDVFAGAEAFSISVLEASQRSVSTAFASRDPAVKLSAAADLIADGAPYVGDSIATFMCTRHAVVDAGDHVILIGKVQRYRSAEAQPLAFFRGAYVGLGPDLRELEQLPANLVVGGVLGYCGKVLLCRRTSSYYWEIPSVTLARGARHGATLKKLFSSLGIEITMLAPYSLFQETNEHDMTLVFSVESCGELKTGTMVDGMETALFGSTDLRSSLVQSQMKRSLVKRYLREMASGLYGMFFDSPEGGSVVALNGRPRAWSEWNTPTMANVDGSRTDTLPALGPVKERGE